MGKVYWLGNVYDGLLYGMAIVIVLKKFGVGLDRYYGGFFESPFGIIR